MAGLVRPGRAAAGQHHAADRRGRGGDPAPGRHREGGAVHDDQVYTGPPDMEGIRQRYFFNVKPALSGDYW